MEKNIYEMILFSFLPYFFSYARAQRKYSIYYESEWDSEQFFLWVTVSTLTQSEKRREKN